MRAITVIAVAKWTQYPRFPWRKSQTASSETAGGTVVS